MAFPSEHPLTAPRSPAGISACDRPQVSAGFPSAAGAPPLPVDQLPCSELRLGSNSPGPRFPPLGTQKLLLRARPLRLWSFVRSFQRARQIGQVVSWRASPSCKASFGRRPQLLERQHENLRLSSRLQPSAPCRRTTDLIGNRHGRFLVNSRNRRAHACIGPEHPARHDTTPSRSDRPHRVRRSSCGPCWSRTAPHRARSPALPATGFWSSCRKKKKPPRGAQKKYETATRFSWFSPPVAGLRWCFRNHQRASKRRIARSGSSDSLERTVLQRGKSR